MTEEAAGGPNTVEAGSRRPQLVIVVAMAANGVIGRDNALPWRLKTDLGRFRALTWGKPMIMGRRSWDSVGRALPGRESIVLTRDPHFRREGAQVVGSWQDARDLARDRAAAMGTGEAIVFGGTDVFRLALPEVERLHLTLVEACPDGDVLFPDFDRALFRETFRERHPAGPQDEHAFTFVDLVRRAGEVERHIA